MLKRTRAESNGAARPAFVPPMLAKLVRSLSKGPEWGYEVKFDGYRIEAIKEGSQVRLFSRRGHDFTTRFAQIAKMVSTIKAHSAVIDGEVVAVDEHGHPSFQALQNRSQLPAGWKLVYYAFDLLHLDHERLTAFPLLERRRRLQKILKGSAVLFSPTITESAEVLMQAVRKHQLEGIVAKRLASTYEPGKRSGAWQKLPLKQQRRFVIGGYRPGPRNFEILLVGFYELDKFIFAGKVTQGFNPGKRAAVSKLIKPLETPKCCFANLPRRSKGPFGEGVTAEEMHDYVWVLPLVVAEIRFAEWTRGDVLRHAEFVTIHEGVNPREVMREQ